MLADPHGGASMTRYDRTGSPRLVRPTHALKTITADPPFERAFADHLRATLDGAALVTLLDRFVDGSDAFDMTMRRIVWRAMGVTLGDGVLIGRNVRLRDAATFTIGSGVVIGDGAILQGRHDGACRIGDGVWIGPQAFIDGRDLVIADAVGLGPGVRIIGSQHTGLPPDLPVIATELDTQPIRIEAGAEIGTGTIVLPGITIGRGAIIGAGAVVTSDVPARTVAAGVPTRVFRGRKDRQR
jgi:acetyltransferase-like isoleucine patch superfamily enzyme